MAEERKRKRRRRPQKPTAQKIAKKYLPILGIVTLGGLLAVSLAPAWNASGAGTKLQTGASNLVTKMRPGTGTSSPQEVK